MVCHCSILFDPIFHSSFQACTFENNAKSANCQMCNTRRPSSRSNTCLKRKCSDIPSAPRSFQKKSQEPDHPSSIEGDKGRVLQSTGDKGLGSHRRMDEIKPPTTSASSSSSSSFTTPPNAQTSRTTDLSRFCEGHQIFENGVEGKVKCQYCALR